MSKKKTLSNPELDAWLRELPVGENEQDGFRLLGRREVLALPWEDGYLSDRAEAAFLREQGIELLPFATDDGSNLLAVYLNGPLVGRVVFVDHETSDLPSVFRSIQSVRMAFESGNRFSRHWADFVAYRTARSDEELSADREAFVRYLEFARTVRLRGKVAKNMIARELQVLTPIGEEAQTVAILRELQLNAFDRLSNPVHLLEDGEQERARRHLKQMKGPLSDGTRLLELATSQGNEELTRLLLSKGVVPSRTCLVNTLRCLPQYAARLLDLITDRGEHEMLAQVLIELAADDDHAAVELLLRRGAPLDALDADGQTALAAAFFAEHAEMVRKLLDAGAHSFGTVTSSDSVHFGDEHVAIAYEHRTRLNLKELAAISDARGLSILTRAIQGDETDIVEDLLKAGVPANDPHALEVAILRGNLRCARLLADREAPLSVSYATLFNVVSTAGTLDLDDSARAALVQICNAQHALLPVSPPNDGLGWGHPKGALLVFAVENRFEQTAHALLDAGYFHNGLVQENTALTWAAFHGFASLVERLLELGLPANAADFCYAAESGSVDVMHLLLNQEPKLINQYVNGETALLVAAEAGHVRAVEWLLGAGADPTLTDADERTAEERAKRKKHRQVAAVLAAAR